mmetsp:Transcript_41896/g.97012  ORF Transcript_41896/g.97012 Transcript_41896/m.97012 type:complete len:84 (-) Transcript_41896:293-544(-)
MPLLRPLLRSPRPRRFGLLFETVELVAVPDPLWMAAGTVAPKRSHEDHYVSASCQLQCGTVAVLGAHHLVMGIISLEACNPGV